MPASEGWDVGGRGGRGVELRTTMAGMEASVTAARSLAIGVTAASQQHFPAAASMRAQTHVLPQHMTWPAAGYATGTASNAFPTAVSAAAFCPSPPPVLSFSPSSRTMLSSQLLMRHMGRSELVQELQSPRVPGGSVSDHSLFSPRLLGTPLALHTRGLATGELQMSCHISPGSMRSGSVAQEAVHRGEPTFLLTSEHPSPMPPMPPSALIAGAHADGPALARAEVMNANAQWMSAQQTQSRTLAGTGIAAIGSSSAAPFPQHMLDDECRSLAPVEDTNESTALAAAAQLHPTTVPTAPAVNLAPIATSATSSASTPSAPAPYPIVARNIEQSCDVVSRDRTPIGPLSSEPTSNSLQLIRPISEMTFEALRSSRVETDLRAAMERGQAITVGDIDVLFLFASSAGSLYSFACAALFSEGSIKPMQIQLVTACLSESISQADFRKLARYIPVPVACSTRAEFALSPSCIQWSYLAQLCSRTLRARLSQCLTRQLAALCCVVCALTQDESRTTARLKRRD